jgi:hypothetical protein
MKPAIRGIDNNQHRNGSIAANRAARIQMVDLKWYHLLITFQLKGLGK